MIGRLLRWAADQLDPPARRESPLYPLRVDGSVFTDEAMNEQRREDAMALMDEETYGYLLVTIHDEGTFAKAVVKTALSAAMWPAVTETLCRIVVAADKVAGK